MFEKEAKERARDYTDNKERQIAYECGFLDGADRMRGEMQKLKEDNADLKQSLDWANEREKELKAQIEKMKCCENCKHHYWLYEELMCRIHKIDVDTCNSWEVKEND